MPGAKALKVEDLAHQTLLHDERRDNWLVWLRAVGASRIDAAAGPRFSDPGLAIEAACAGNGIALASDVLALDTLESGALKAPFGGWLVVEAEYRLAYPRWLQGDEAMRAFVAFVSSEANECRQRLDRRRANSTLLTAPAAEGGALRAD